MTNSTESGFQNLENFYVFPTSFCLIVIQSHSYTFHIPQVEAGNSHHLNSIQIVLNLFRDLEGIILH